MLYKNLEFPAVKNRPYFYTNFVATVDGKVQVTKNSYAYWPIGSKKDYQTLLELRAYSDVLIHGKNTALWTRHVDNLAKKEFKILRKKLGKENDLVYMVLSNNPDKKLLDNLSSFYKNTFLVTSKAAALPSQNAIHILRIGEKNVDLKKVSKYLYKNGYRNVLIEGGPRLLGAFLKEGLLDEIFLTIAPKIFGNENNSTLTMIEGCLFPPDKVKTLKLLSVKKVNNEVYLRYKMLHPRGVFRLHLGS